MWRLISANPRSPIRPTTLKNVDAHSNTTQMRELEQNGLEKLEILFYIG